MRETATLWSVKPDGSASQTLETAVTGQVDEPGSFSPGGAQLAFTRQPHIEHGTVVRFPRVMTMPAGGGVARTMIADAQEPAFSPDGRRLAYDSTRDRNGVLSYGDLTRPAMELYVARADGTDPQRLTSTRNIDEDTPSWSPDGRAIAYQRGEVTGNAEGTARGRYLQAAVAGTRSWRIRGLTLGTWNRRGVR